MVLVLFWGNVSAHKCATYNSKQCNFNPYMCNIAMQIVSDVNRRSASPTPQPTPIRPLSTPIHCPGGSAAFGANVGVYSGDGSVCALLDQKILPCASVSGGQVQCNVGMMSVVISEYLREGLC